MIFKSSFGNANTILCTKGLLVIYNYCLVNKTIVFTYFICILNLHFLKMGNLRGSNVEVLILTVHNWFMVHISISIMTGSFDGHFSVIEFGHFSVWTPGQRYIILIDLIAPMSRWHYEWWGGSKNCISALFPGLIIHYI